MNYATIEELDIKMLTAFLYSDQVSCRQLSECSPVHLCSYTCQGWLFAVIGSLSGVGITGDVAIQLETANYITVPESRIQLVSDEIFSCENLV